MCAASSPTTAVAAPPSPALSCLSPLASHLVRTGVLTLDKLVELMAVNPRKRFGFPLRADDYAVWDLNTEYRIDPAQFCSMGKSTPFAGQTVYGRCVRNVCGGAVVWQDAQD